MVGMVLNILLALAKGAGGLVFKNMLGLAWEFATIAQVATCLVAYWAGGFLPTASRERASRDALFAQLAGRASSADIKESERT